MRDIINRHCQLIYENRDRLSTGIYRLILRLYCDCIATLKINKYVLWRGKWTVDISWDLV